MNGLLLCMPGKGETDLLQSWLLFDNKIRRVRRQVEQPQSLLAFAFVEVSGQSGHCLSCCTYVSCYTVCSHVCLFLYNYIVLFTAMSFVISEVQN